MNRRRFLSTTSGGVLAGSAAWLGACGAPSSEISGLRLKPSGTLGGLIEEPGPAPIEGATWYTAGKTTDGLSFSFPEGALAGKRYITADFLLDGNHLIVFRILLREGEKGRHFDFKFGGLNQCSFRVRLPLSLVNQNRWGIDREGAFLKPRVGGDRVDLEKVDRMAFQVLRKSPETARWAMTGFVATDDDVPLIPEPLLPQGPLLDELGQSRIHQWPAKTKSVEEAVALIRDQHESAPKQELPANWSAWGGWEGLRLSRGDGYFRTRKEDGRWWLIDPDGYAFWSIGLDCFRVDTMALYSLLESALEWLPDKNGEFREAFISEPGYNVAELKSFSFLAANMIRAFGPNGWRRKWADIGLGLMRQIRFNTVGNWSKWDYARAVQFPYVRPMSFGPKRTSFIYRDFPDVFHPDFVADANDYASVLTDSRDDPAFVGYFLMNEPQWGFSRELPAAGMLYVTPECHTRAALAAWLRNKYADDQALAAAWKLETSFAKVTSGAWTGVLTPEANTDLKAFSVVMATRYFKAISEACRRVDPNHLNLGMRWAGVPPEWAVEGMKSFDVFSMNCYRERVPRDVTDKVEAMLGMPVIIGEWHFGALDVGLPASGIGHLKNQAERAKAYRVYIEDAAANPNCVGAHWFTLYDESALGRFDGENYNIGFLDVCNRPYAELSAAATTSHERLYEVAAGRRKPFDVPLKYLPKLY